MPAGQTVGGHRPVEYVRANSQTWAEWQRLDTCHGADHPLGGSPPGRSEFAGVAVTLPPGGRRSLKHLCLSGFLLGFDVVMPFAECLEVGVLVRPPLFSVNDVVDFELGSPGASKPGVSHDGCALVVVSGDDAVPGGFGEGGAAWCPSHGGGLVGFVVVAARVWLAVFGCDIPPLIIHPVDIFVKSPLVVGVSACQAGLVRWPIRWR